MSIRQYVVIGSSYGILTAYIIVAHNCQPLLVSDLINIANQHFDAFCYLQSYQLEPPELNYPIVPQTPALTAVVSSGTTTTHTIQKSLTYSIKP